MFNLAGGQKHRRAFLLQVHIHQCSRMQLDYIFVAFYWFCVLYTRLALKRRMSLNIYIKEKTLLSFSIINLWHVTSRIYKLLPHPQACTFLHQKHPFLYFNKCFILLMCSSLFKPLKEGLIWWHWYPKSRIGCFFYFVSFDFSAIDCLFHRRTLLGLGRNVVLIKAFKGYCYSALCFI